MGHLMLVVLSVALFWGTGGVQSLTIKVVDLKGDVKRDFTDSTAAFQGRAYLLPTKEKMALKGFLVYPNPRNACSVVENPQNDTFIAFLSEYVCPDAAESNLKAANYAAMVVYTNDKNGYLGGHQLLPQALITDTNFATYLMSTVIPVNNSMDLQVVIWDNSFAKLEQLFIIFGSILLAAVFLSVCVFCTSLFCRVAIVRWRTRGLTSWQVRALPKRKYRKVKERADTCSICLEEFKEGETVRVLPCDHVFHPKCVDEWLHKWNRTCPLCKSTIKRKGGKTNNPPAHTDDNEASVLLPQERTSAIDDDQLDGATPANQYGSTGVTTVVFHKNQHHRGTSTCSNISSSDSRTVNKNQVTSVEIELSGSVGSGDGRLSTTLYHTPLHSDEEDHTPSYATAHSGHTSTEPELASQEV